MKKAQKEGQVKDLFRRGLLMGLGAAEYTREALARAITELEKKGDVSRGEAKKMMDSFTKTAAKRRKDFEKSVEKAFSRVLAGMNIATEDRFAKLDKRLRAVERKLKTKK